MGEIQEAAVNRLGNLLEVERVREKGIKEDSVASRLHACEEDGGIR